MKNKKLYWGVLLSATILGGTSLGTTASAAVVEGQSSNTPATVTLKDNTDVTDPLDPEDPNQKHLLLTAVPSAYSYESELKTNGSYSISGSVTGENKNISVFNDRSSRNWSVKATVDNEELTLGSEKFTVSNFTINDTALVGTGINGIVAKNVDNSETNNTGTINTEVTKTSIEFSDPNSLLKAGDTLAGTVSYQLYNTADAS